MQTVSQNIMLTITLLFFLALIGIQTMSGQNLLIPKNYSIVDTVKGDLNKDGIDELVIAYNTQKEKEDTFESVPRELIIYKKESNNWVVWKKSKSALYGSQDGGMMGDPFEEIKIKNGILLVSQNGGSSWKWGHTDKYCYQDGEFHLIGYSSTYGRLCDYWTDVDFNLLTGKMIVKKEYESCENGDEQKIYKRKNETVNKKVLKITMEKRNKKEIKIVTPKYRHEIYITKSSD